MDARKAAACALLSAALASAWAAKKNGSKKTGGSQGTKLSMPERRKADFFADVDKSALALVEEGSPGSLVRALAALRRSGGSYTDAERVLLFAASSALRVCYPSAYRAEYEVALPADLSSNTYVGAVKFALDGLYDFAAGDSDFLSLALPSLALLVSAAPDADSLAAAEKSLAAARRLRPSSALAAFLEGRLLSLRGEFAAAAASLDAAHKAAPESPEITFALAESLFRAGDEGGADALARSLVAASPQDRKALKLCAETAFASGDWEDAEMYVARVLQQEPGSSYYLLFRVKILMRKGDFVRAASLLDVYSRTDSESRDYLLLRAQIQRDWNKSPAAAAQTLEKAVSLHPADAEVLLEAARLASATGGTVAGMTLAELSAAVLSLEPDNADAKLLSVDALAAARRWDEARAAAKSLMDELGAESPDRLKFAYIDSCLNSGRQEEAWRVASAMYGERGTDEGVLTAYLSVLVATGRKKDARSLVERLLPQSSQKFRSLLYYQRSLLAAGEDDALSDLRASLTANPRNRDSLFRLYEIYFAKKEYRKAQYYLKQVVALAPSDENLLSLNANLDALLGK